MTAIPVIAIFDIGKTNKKFFLLDEQYCIVLERNRQIQETSDEDGEGCEDVDHLSKWIIKTCTEILQDIKWDVKAINFSAYGASFVYIDNDGKVIAPLYNYLKKYPEKIKHDLYEKYGGAEKISLQTASPVLDSLNSGMQLYRIKLVKPELFQQIKYALHLPQYISYLITGQPCSDITSIGSHTQLWDYQKNNYHEWVIAEGIDIKLAPILASDNTTEIFFAGKKIKAGTGLHDSSAALIPYQAAFKEPFVLISTGTWCISLNPFNNNPLTHDELKEDCLCYMDYGGKPVKASRLFAGHYHEQEIKKVAQHFNIPVDFYKEIKYNPAILSMLHQSVYNTKDLSSFNNPEEAYHSLMADIIHQQHFSTELIMRNTPVHRIFVDGGFSNNSIYMHLLALVFPQLEVYAASVAQATAMGAALAIHDHWNIQPLPSDMVKLKFYKANTLDTNS